MSKTSTTPEAPKTLAAALTSLEEARAAHTVTQTELASITSRAEAAESERDSLRGQFEAATTSVDAMRAERDAALTELATAREESTRLSAERDEVTGRATRAEENVTRLERLCQVRGVDSKAAVTSVDGNPESSSTAADLRKQFAEISDPTERAKFWKANEAVMLE